MREFVCLYPERVTVYLGKRCIRSELQEKELEKIGGVLVHFEKGALGDISYLPSNLVSCTSRKSSTLHF